MSNRKLLTTESLKTVLPVLEDSIVNQLKSKEIKTVEPLDNDIPMVFLTGEFPTDKIYVKGELEYVSKTDKFHAYTYIKLQGNSTLELPKKNVTIQMYKDEDRSKKLNKEFKSWGAHNNYVIKADYHDILRARNVVCAKLWGKVVANRRNYDDLPAELKNSPNYGAIDGFPVKIFVNGEYYGLCNWTIPKCDWMVGMNGNNPNHALLCAEINDNGFSALSNNPCNFRTFWSGIDGDGWSIEVGVASENLTGAFRNVSGHLMDSWLEPHYIDVQGVIDYFIFQDVILGTDGLAKNMLMATYDMCKFYVIPYDMNATFDMHWEGYLLHAFTADIGSHPYLNHYSRLLETVFGNHMDEYKARYAELRNAVLSETSIISEFENYVNVYGDDVYIKDTIMFPDIPEVTTNNLEYIRKFVKDRLAYLDSCYLEVNA